jgi:N-acetylneuraminic acid mutarotase
VTPRIRAARARAGALVTACLALASGCVGATTDSPAPVDQTAPGTWTVAAPLPTARQEVAVAVLGGHVYVIGGLGETAEPLNTVESYDPAADRWRRHAPLPVAVHHPAAAAVGGRLFVVGGFSGGRIRWTAENALYEYDAQRDAWTARAPMPTPRGALAVAVLDGRLHAVGGSGDGVSHAHEVYDPQADRWSAANAMPTARDHLAAVAFQGRLWTIGGRESFLGTQFANVEIYDPASDSWRTGPPLPVGRGGLAAAALDDRVLVFGGEAPLRIFNATEMYEIAGDRWIAKAPMPTARHGIGAGVVGGRVYVPGGGTRPGLAASAAHEVYTP